MSEGKIVKKWTYLLTGHLALIHIIGRDILELKEREGRSTTLHTYTHRPSSLNPLPAKGQHHYREKNTLYQLVVALNAMTTLNMLSVMQKTPNKKSHIKSLKWH